MRLRFNVFWLAAFTFLFLTSAHAETCPDLHLNGTWLPQGTQLFGDPWVKTTYEISQRGCYVLVLDTTNNATWKFDLSGANPVRVPEEMVRRNLEGDGPAAAKNISDLQVRFESPNSFSNGYSARLVTDANLAPTRHFPFGLAAHVGAYMFIEDDSNCPIAACTSGPRHSITIELREVKIADVTSGFPSNFDKSSFLAGVNTVLKLTVGAMPTTLVNLVKDE